MKQWYFSTQEVRHSSKELSNQLDCSILSADECQTSSICSILVNILQLFTTVQELHFEELKALLSRF